MTTGTDFLQSLPKHAGSDREQAIIAAVRAGEYAPIEWSTLSSVANGRSLVLYVAADALRIGTADDSVRVNACARSAQQIADLLGCVLPTTKICDLIWEQAVVRVTPCIGGAGKDMTDTVRMAAHHACVEAKVAGRSGLIENVGKHWVIANELSSHVGFAANYGWFDPSAPYHSRPSRNGPLRLWQSLGTRHSIAYVDYSQVVRLVYRACVLDGEQRDLVDVMRDPALASLVSDEGPMHLTRIPGVPPTMSQVA